MKIFIIIIMIVYIPNLSAQTDKLGGGISVGLGNQILTKGIGINLLYERDILPSLSFRPSFSFSLSHYQYGSTIADKSTYTIGKIELLAIYHPLQIGINPYIGTGGGYYFTNTGFEKFNYNFSTGRFIRNESVEVNNYGISILAGFNVTPEKRLNLMVEYKYSFVYGKQIFVWNNDLYEKELNLSEGGVCLIILFNL